MSNKRKGYIFERLDGEQAGRDAVKALKANGAYDTDILEQAIRTCYKGITDKDSIASLMMIVSLTYDYYHKYNMAVR